MCATSDGVASERSNSIGGIGAVTIFDMGVFDTGIAVASAIVGDPASSMVPPAMSATGWTAARSSAAGPSATG